MDPFRPKAVVSNTGPVISALQSGCMPILYQFYDQIHIPRSELTEYDKHGAGQEIRALTDAGLLVVNQVTASEEEAARLLLKRSQVIILPGIKILLTIFPNRNL
jgi:hypothetical protein